MPDRCRLQSRASDEGPIEIHPIVGRAFARARPKCRRIEHGNENDSSQHILQLDLAHEVLEHDRPFVLVAVIRAESDQPFARLGPWADPHRERNQVIAPNAVVFQGDPIVAATWANRGRVDSDGQQRDSIMWDLSSHIAPHRSNVIKQEYSRTTLPLTSVRRKSRPA